MADAHKTVDALALERSRLEAMRENNAAKLDELLHSQFSFTHMNGLIEGKEQFLDRIKAGQVRYHPALLSETKTEHFGEQCVIVTGRAQLSVEVLAQNKTFEMDNRFMSVWIKNASKWQAAAYQSTPIQ